MKIYDNIAHVTIQEVLEKDPPIGLVILLFKNEAKKDIMSIFNLYDYMEYHSWLRENFPTKTLGVNKGKRRIFYFKTEKNEFIKCSLCLIDCGLCRLIKEDGDFIGEKVGGLDFEPKKLLYLGSELYDENKNFICKYNTWED